LKYIFNLCCTTLQDHQELQKHRLNHRVVVRLQRRRRPQRRRRLKRRRSPERLERRPNTMHAKHYALDLLLLRRCMIS
jgi:hypothetical protein